MFITTLDNTKRDIDWSELNQLKKDILWIFDFNTNDLNSAFVPELSFTNKYWEYLTLDAEESLSTKELTFYKQGILIVLLCMTIEYVDTIGGNQQVFSDTPVHTINTCVELFKPENQNQEKLQSILLLGLAIARAMSPQDLLNTDGYNHPNFDTFYSQLNWVDDTFIKTYFRSKLN